MRSSLSSESSSLSYCPRNDIPGACAASFSLSLSLSFGCSFPRCDPERVETFSGAVDVNDGVDTSGTFCWAWLEARRREEVRGPEGPGVDVDAAGDVGTFIVSEEMLVLEGPAWGSSSSTMIRSSYMAMRRVDYASHDHNEFSAVVTRPTRAERLIPDHDEYSTSVSISSPSNPHRSTSTIFLNCHLHCTQTNSEGDLHPNPCLYIFTPQSLLSIFTQELRDINNQPLEVRAQVSLYGLHASEAPANCLDLVSMLHRLTLEYRG